MLWNFNAFGTNSVIGTNIQDQQMLPGIEAKPYSSSGLALLYAPQIFSSSASTEKSLSPP